jgi:hypothetical protein
MLGAARRIRHQTSVAAATLMPDEAPRSITFAPGMSAPAASASLIASGRLTVLVLPKRLTVLHIFSSRFPGLPMSAMPVSMKRRDA